MEKLLSTDAFSYELPVELIAQFPLSQRTASRLLVLNKKTLTWSHENFFNIVDYINANDLLVLNNTKVMLARLWGYKKTGGRVECLVERLLCEDQLWVQASQKLNISSEIFFGPDFSAQVLARENSFYLLKVFSDKKLTTLLEHYGKIPLPLYIRRSEIPTDYARYQTIFAKKLGAVAAPTAGLHFDEVLFQKLREKGVAMTEVTLHIGSGTFKPVRATFIQEHQMHKEYIAVTEDTWEAIRACQKRAGRVIAVGTTVVRALETCAAHSVRIPYKGFTKLFIYPGYKFRLVDGLITNFHLPKSTLYLLVSAFAGSTFIATAYREAVKQQYRFFSYGDAMFIL